MPLHCWCHSSSTDFCSSYASLTLFLSVRLEDALSSLKSHIKHHPLHEAFTIPASQPGKLPTPMTCVLLLGPQRLLTQIQPASCQTMSNLSVGPGTQQLLLANSCSASLRSRHLNSSVPWSTGPEGISQAGLQDRVVWL